MVECKLTDVQSLFDELLAVPPSERDAFLTSRGVNDDTKSELARLLRGLSEADAAGFLERDWAPTAGEESWIGRRIGPYRLERLLNRGGMGEVYLAERQDGIRQQTAVKLLSRGIDSDQMLRRFEQEKQVLAQLTHPKIARFLDSGRTDEGRPYLVMEFVDGANIVKACRDWPLERKVRVLGDVCAAIEYAHERGAIHRDLKPGNILVTAEGDVRVVDFGLAGRKSPDESLDLTRTGQMLGTPSYMAPEQADGAGKARVETDVYGLGAVLYELLVGRPPFKAETTYATLRLVKEAEPVAPRRLRADVPLDLETICLKCLEKAPERRYATAGALADDLRHWLAGEPIAARPIGLGERLLRWLRREPYLASFAATLLIVMLGSSITFFALWRESTINRDAARDRQTVAMNALDVLIKSSKQRFASAVPMSDAEKADLVKSLEIYSGLLADERADESTRYRAATAYRDIMWIYYHLAEWTRSQKEAEKAIAVLEGLKESDPDDERYPLDLARSYCMLANIYSYLSSPKAEMSKYMRLSVDEAEWTIERFGPTPERAGALACHQASLADVLYFAGQTEEPAALLAKARVVEERLLADRPDNPHRYTRLATVLRLQGRLAHERGDDGEAIEAHEKTRVLARQLAEQFPQEPLAATELADYSYLAMLYRQQGHLAKALDVLRDSRDLSRTLASRYPNVKMNISTEARANQDLGYLTPPGAARDSYFRAALDAYNRFDRFDGSDYITTTYFCFFLAFCPDAACRDAARAEALIDKVVRQFPDHPAGQEIQAMLFFRYGNGKDQPPEVREPMMAKLMSAGKADRPFAPIVAMILADLGELERARTLLEEIKAEYGRRPPTDHFSLFYLEEAESRLFGCRVIDGYRLFGDDRLVLDADGKE